MIAETLGYMKKSANSQKSAKEASFCGRPLLHCSRFLIDLNDEDFNQRLREQLYLFLTAHKFPLPIDIKFFVSSRLQLTKTPKHFQRVTQ